MSIFRIALRSLQHRGVGSLLTIISMALGVMLVVGVLTIYGVVERSFRTNSSFGYDVIVGARGGSTQLMLNTVFYLSKPVENIPYEYYLAFLDKQSRANQLEYSIAFNTFRTRQQARQLAEQQAALIPFAGPGMLMSSLTGDGLEYAEQKAMTIKLTGTLYPYTDHAIPVALGDYFNEKFRVVGTTPAFFHELVLDVETEKPFTFSAGRAFEVFNEQHGYFEAVVGSTVARESNIQVGDVIYPIHGDPNYESAHIHEQGFTVVGILEPTGTANDRVAFTNLEGHFLMEDHAKPIEEKTIYDQAEPAGTDLLDSLDGLEADMGVPAPEDASESELDAGQSAADATTAGAADQRDTNPASLPADEQTGSPLARTRLPVEQREITAILVRSYVSEEENEFEDLGLSAPIIQSVNDGQLAAELAWSDYRPTRFQGSAQAVSPVYEVTSLFENIISPIRWLLLLLTVMICFVSAISILVGIYSSMSLRRQELAVMRALGAGRATVMLIMLMESALLAAAGGVLGWVSGHLLNVAVSPIVERNTGVPLNFFDLAPPVPVFAWILPQGITFLPQLRVESWTVSPEFLVIPGLVVLSLVVGIYPAVAAYRTDVANSLSD